MDFLPASLFVSVVDPSEVEMSKRFVCSEQPPEAPPNIIESPVS